MGAIEAGGGQTGRRDPVVRLSVQGPDKKGRHSLLNQNVLIEMYILNLLS